MNRILGIDYGSAKIGLALSDPLKMFAHEYETIFTKENKNYLHYIVDLCNEKNVEYVVLGLPLNMDGSVGFQAEEVLAFKHKLESLQVKVVTEDERLTTKMAESAMHEMKLSKKEILQKSDAKAAAIILQNHLDYI